MSHTPGPWSVHNKPGFSRLFIASDTYDVAEMCHAGDEKREAANARLIAAAPEMLEELRATDGWLAELCDWIAQGDFGAAADWVAANADWVTHHDDAVRGLISKAEGRDA